MALPLPTGWSQQEFEDFFSTLSTEAGAAADAFVRIRSEPALQVNVDQWLTTGGTSAPLPTGWSGKEFSDWITDLTQKSDLFYRQYMLSRTPPELQPNILERLGAPWPYPIDNLMWDFDFVGRQYHSGSLGTITEAQAFTEERASVNDLAFNGNNKLVAFPANTPRIAAGRGKWAEATRSGRVDRNCILNDVLWVNDGFTLVQDLPSPFEVGTPLGWRLTATKDNATLTQMVTTITKGVTTESHPNGLFYRRASDVHTGQILLTQDGHVTGYNILQKLTSPDVWKQVGGPPQTLPDVPEDRGFGIKATKAGDTIGFMMGNVQRGFLMTSPVVVPGTSVVNGLSDLTRQNMANFPPLWNKSAFTLIMVVEPRATPLPAFGDLAHPRPGWTCWEFNKPFTIKATGTGGIQAGMGSPGRPGGGNYDRLTIQTADPVGPPIVPAPTGDFAFVDPTYGRLRLVVGTGVQNYTDIVAQTSGTPGLNGTYDCYSSLGPQNTSSMYLSIEARIRDAVGYGLNAALKPDDDFHQRIGLTITYELFNISFGYDPQTEDYYYNRINAEGFSVDYPTSGLIVARGIISLRGDVEHARADQFTQALVMTPDSGIVIGSQGPNGGGPTNGVLQRNFCVGRWMDDAELNGITIAMHSHYDRGFDQ
jgi:hypothetical protein